MSQLLTETLLPFHLAPTEIPGKPHISTLHRWRERGLHGIKLETILVGGRRFTSREALERFFDTLTAGAGGHQSASRTTRQRERDRSAASERLRAAGILKLKK